MKSITVSAPGKLMLLGEHAVVYGEPCLVTAVDSRLGVTIASSVSTGVIIDAPQVKDTRFVEAAIKAFSFQLSAVSNIKIVTKSPFSGKFGFGSSSAVTVAVLKALSMYFAKPLSQRELFDLSYQVVMDVQKTGSGFDVAAATYGGTLYFKKGGAVLEELSVDWRSVALVIGYSGVKSNTVALIKQVADLKKQYPEKSNRLFSAITQLVMQGKQALLQGDWKRLGTYMNFNQDFLRDLGVSSHKLEALISAANHAGAYGAKLSGAGGGDCMIALVPLEKKSAVEGAISQAGGEIISVAVDTEGVREEILQGKGFRVKGEVHSTFPLTLAPSL